MSINLSKLKVSRLVNDSLKRHGNLDNFLENKITSQDFIYSDNDFNVENLEVEFDNIIKLAKCVSTKIKKIKLSIAEYVKKCNVNTDVVDLIKTDKLLDEALKILMEQRYKLNHTNYQFKDKLNIYKMFLMNENYFNKIMEEEHKLDNDKLKFKLNLSTVFHDRHIETIKEMMKLVNMKTKHGTSLNELLDSCNVLYQEFKKLDVNRNKRKTQRSIDLLELNKLENIIIKIKNDCVFMQNMYKNSEKLSEQESLELDKKYENTKGQYKNLVSKLGVLKKRLSFYEKDRGEIDNSIKAPTGYISIIFTDIKNSTKLWETSTDLMMEVIKLHNKEVRILIKHYNGYEVKTEGDSFMCTFKKLENCLNFAIDVQLKLMDVKWPKAILKNPEVKQVYKDNRMLFNGIRVRIGINIGNPITEINPTTGRTDYFGPVVNKGARIEGVAKGGQIVISEAIKTYLDIFTDIKEKIIMYKVPNQKLKGIDGEEDVYIIYPKELMGRHEYLKSFCRTPNDNNIEEQVKDVKFQIDEYKQKIKEEHLGYKEKLEESSKTINSYKKTIDENKNIINDQIAKINDLKEIIKKLKSRKRKKKKTRSRRTRLTNLYISKNEKQGFPTINR